MCEPEQGCALTGDFLRTFVKNDSIVRSFAPPPPCIILAYAHLVFGVSARPNLSLLAWILVLFTARRARGEGLSPLSLSLSPRGITQNRSLTSPPPTLPARP